LASWASARRDTGASEQTVQVLSGDWGAVTLKLTQAYGKCFAVLNMANAYAEHLEAHLNQWPRFTESKSVNVKQISLSLPSLFIQLDTDLTISSRSIGSFLEISNTRSS
jgi:hypothetical protein